MDSVALSPQFVADGYDSPKETNNLASPTQYALLSLPFPCGFTIAL